MIKNLVLRLPVLFLGLFLVNACSTGENDPIVVPLLENEFYAELRDQFTPQGREVTIRLSTIEDVACKNALIEYNLLRQGDNEQVLSIESIETPDGCEEGSAPARVTVNMGPLEHGVYPLTFSLRDAISSEGLITIDADRLRLSIESGGGVVPLRFMTGRIPVNTFWGYFDTQGNEDKTIVAESFLAALNNLAQPQVMADGHYGYFSINENSDIRWEEGTDEENGTRFAFQFRIPNADRVADIKSLITNYRNNHGDTISISVMTTKGERW